MVAIVAVDNCRRWKLLYSSALFSVSLKAITGSLFVIIFSLYSYIVIQFLFMHNGENSFELQLLHTHLLFSTRILSFSLFCNALPLSIIFPCSHTIIHFHCRLSLMCVLLLPVILKSVTRLSIYFILHLSLSPPLTLSL